MIEWENLLNLVFSAAVGSLAGFTLVSLVCLLVFKPSVQAGGHEVDQAYSDGFDDGYEDGYREAERDILGDDDDE